MTTTELLANLTPRFAATWMNGREYRDEMPNKTFLDDLRLSRTVVVYGASDDLVEFEGAICDEIGAGEKIFLSKEGIVDNSPYWIEPVWCGAGSSATWTYETNIPGVVRFMIMEDDEAYCEGIAFSLDDL